MQNIDPQQTKATINPVENSPDNDMVTEDYKEVTTMTYGEIDRVKQNNEQNLDMKYESTTNMSEEFIEYFQTETALFEDNSNNQSKVGSTSTIYIPDFQTEQAPVEDQSKKNPTMLYEVTEDNSNNESKSTSPEFVSDIQAEQTTVKDQLHNQSMQYEVTDLRKPEQATFQPKQEPQSATQKQTEKTKYDGKVKPVQYLPEQFVVLDYDANKQQQVNNGKLSKQAESSDQVRFLEENVKNPEDIPVEKYTSVYDNLKYEAEEHDYPVYEVEEHDYMVENDYPVFESKIDTKQEIVLPPKLLLPIPNNHIDNEILDPNQITPRVSGQCFRFDCLAQPYHDCCSPHTANKRQTGPGVSFANHNLMKHALIDHPGRVTATVTRVPKTVRW